MAIAAKVEVVEVSEQSMVGYTYILIRGKESSPGMSRFL